VDSVKHGKSKVSEAASLMGRRSATARKERWGEAEFHRRMQEWGRLGGRPRSSDEKLVKKGRKPE
jgi:hypothetical protein